eukprot:15325678-Ditylum_brightwellii.AAC.1
MEAQIRMWKLEGQVLLMANINSPLGKEKIGEFICNTGLVNLVGVKHGISTINSHISGNRQIDYILGMENIAKSVAEVGILPFHTYITSDHRGIFVDINYKLLFTEDFHDHEPSQLRKVSSKNKKQSKKLIEYVTEGFITKGIKQRTTELIKMPATSQ